MKPSNRFRLFSFTFHFLALSILVFFSCRESNTGTPIEDNSIPKGNVHAKTATTPDLMISAINVYPIQPTAGTAFTFNVYVKNQGNAASGEYDLAIYILDLSRNLTYPIGTFRNSALQAGEEIAVYQKNDQLVNDPGAFQIHCELKPFLFTDGNEGNNLMIWAFQAN